MDGYDPVFIGGDGRSGTTLLVDLMGFHPDISPIYETNFIVRIANLLGNERVHSRLRDPWIIRRVISKSCRNLPTSRVVNHRGTDETFFHGPNHILLEPSFVREHAARLRRGVRWGDRNAAFGTFISALFDQHCKADSKSRWVNKTPRNINIWPRLHQALPDMRLIHIVRDGRDVACSYMRRWGTDDVTGPARDWIRAMRSGAEFAQRYPEQYLCLKYEDLLTGPAGELDRIFSWLGETPCAREILRRYEDAGFVINPSRVGNWKKEITPRQRDDYERIAGDMLDRFGYRNA